MIVRPTTRVASIFEDQRLIFFHPCLKQEVVLELHFFLSVDLRSPSPASMLSEISY